MVIESEKITKDRNISILSIILWVYQNAFVSIRHIKLYVILSDLVVWILQIVLDIIQAHHNQRIKNGHAITYHWE